MNEICLLDNPVMPYPWGSYTAIAGLLGQPSPSPDPQAELWMGAHPKAPSRVLRSSGPQSMLSLFDEDAPGLMGSQMAERFAGRLPFLFKVLAAETPLSIQAHPDKQQAEEGFKREQGQGIPIDAPHRSYRDDNHKPEILCAVTPFWGLMGFRGYEDCLDRLRRLNCPSMRDELDAFARSHDSAGLRRFFVSLLTMEEARKQAVIREAVEGAGKGPRASAEADWLLAIHTHYPSDIGILAPMMLNLVKLEPGQAMFMKAGELHAYLKGVGIELMANSDNVLRGGLTPKHIDIPELLKVLSFEPSGVARLEPAPNERGERIYTTPSREFLLTALDLHGTYAGDRDRSAEIWIVMEGEGTAINTAAGQSVALSKGVSFLVPASVPEYRLSGRARLFRASIPH